MELLFDPVAQTTEHISSAGIMVTVPWLSILYTHVIWPLEIMYMYINSLRPRPNGRQFPDDIFKCIFLTENVIISIKISLKFVPKGSINNIATLVQITAWRRPGDKPLSEPMMVWLTTHICVTRPQWVESGSCKLYMHIQYLIGYLEVN